MRRRLLARLGPWLIVWEVGAFCLAFPVVASAFAGQADDWRRASAAWAGAASAFAHLWGVLF